MATRLNKKALFLSLLGIFALSACDEIKSYPNDGAILPPNAENNKDIYNNELESIYEGIRDGSLASDVLDKLLYEYANTIFGRFSSKAPKYATFTDSGKVEGKTLSEVGPETVDEATKKEFISAHKAYWPGEEAPANNDEWELAIAKLNAIYNSINDRIAESLYNKISGGSFSEHNIFSERKFLVSLYFDGKNVEDYATIAPADLYEGIIDPSIKQENVFINNEGEGFLHQDYYYSDENTYAVEEFIEGIYKDLLTEQYILDESASTLGRSFARKVNIISISVDSDNKSDVPALVDYVLKNYITAKDGANLRFAADPEGSVKSLFNSISNIMRGLPKYFKAADADYDETSKAIVDALFTNYGLYGDTAALIADDSETYLTSTAYGSLMKDYLKIDENLSLTDSSIESSFTGAGSYTVAKGKEYKETEIELKNYTTEGWYIKNGGLTTLPETIRNRLFNISVANALDVQDGGLVDRTDANWNYDAEVKTSKYIAKVNGAYFLKTETVEDKTSNKDLYFYESGSNTYYFVQVIEAVNPSKLSSGAGSYKEIYNDAKKQEDIAREVCEVVGKISSYSTLAKEHWLKQMVIEYHDTVVYEYFKTNYPKLFE